MSDPGGSKRRLIRLAPLVLALFVLAWALGSLPASQAGGSWLINSYWLLYLTALFPVIILAVMVAFVVVLAYNWKDMSNAVGWGIARRRGGKGGNQLVRILVFIATWSLALIVLAFHKSLSPSDATTSLQKVVNDTTTSSPSSLAELGGTATVVTDLVRSDWYFLAFLGLVVVCGLIFVRGVKVSMDLTKELPVDGPFDTQASEGLVAVRDAIKIVREADVGGPRERIVACYERMIEAASRMGASVTTDQTARELETSIRQSFMLRGDGIRTLTGLFEEARYSIHSITEKDSQSAYSSLLSIEEELRSGL